MYLITNATCTHKTSNFGNLGRDAVGCQRTRSTEELAAEVKMHSEGKIGLHLFLSFFAPSCQPL